MEKYENLGLVGEGSYGMVMKCRHKDTGQLVAIKKFLESEDDRMVRKIALREIRMLKQLRHDNLVNLIEVFRRKKRLYLVFEFVDHTILDELERNPHGISEAGVKRILYQVLKGIEFCHSLRIIHRDIKPENILVSKSGVVKLCDFGFARTIAVNPGEAYTDYVATRWYRAPELLVGDTKYGWAVDIWAVGCLMAEMLTGEPLFPGDSDIDQLFLIIKCFGNLSQRYRDIFARNPLFSGTDMPEVRDIEPLDKRFSRIARQSLDIMKECLRPEAVDRPTCSQLLKHPYFMRDGFAVKFEEELKVKIQKEIDSNPLLRNIDTSSSGNSHNRTAGNYPNSTLTVQDNQENHKEKRKKISEKPSHSQLLINTGSIGVTGFSVSPIQSHHSDRAISDMNTAGNSNSSDDRLSPDVSSGSNATSSSTPAPNNASQSQHQHNNGVTTLPDTRQYNSTLTVTNSNNNHNSISSPQLRINGKGSRKTMPHSYPIKSKRSLVSHPFSYVSNNNNGSSFCHSHTNDKRSSSQLLLPEIKGESRASNNTSNNIRSNGLFMVHPGNRNVNPSVNSNQKKKGYCSVMPYLTPLENLIKNSGQVHSHDDEDSFPSV